MTDLISLPNEKTVLTYESFLGGNSYIFNGMPLEGTVYPTYGGIVRSQSAQAVQETTTPFYSGLLSNAMNFLDWATIFERMPENAHVEVVEEPSRTMLQRTKVEIEEVDLSDPRRRLAVEAEALLGYTPLRKELKEPSRLRQVLAKLEIEILEEKSVDCYKKQMVDHYSSSGKMLAPTWRLISLSRYAKPVPEFVLHKAIEIKHELPEARFYIDELAVDPFLIVSLKELPDSTFNHPTRNLDGETAVYVDVWSEPSFEATL